MPKKSSLNILLLFDIPYTPPAETDYRKFMIGDEWKDERDVARALTKLGHKVAAFGIHNDIKPLIAYVEKNRPDVIFNQCESFAENRQNESNLAGLLELLDIPYTGATPDALSICKDKGLSKKILSFHDIRVPEFVVIPRDEPGALLKADIKFPAICKPVGLDSSEGISSASLVANKRDCLGRVKFIHKHYETDAIIEEYITGRELYVGLIGGDKITVLPPQELFFKKLPAKKPRMLTFHAKWNQGYRKKYGIDSGFARNIDAKLLARLKDDCETIFKSLKLKGYARVDLRLNDKNEPVIIEVNPNPSIKKTDDFASAAKRAGISYEELLEEIIDLAIAS
jgi:D-alanine-D-alanine ligase